MLVSLCPQPPAFFITSCVPIIVEVVVFQCVYQKVVSEDALVFRRKHVAELHSLHPAPFTHGMLIKSGVHAVVNGPEEGDIEFCSIPFGCGEVG